jgi:hypothetical protein
MCGIMIDDLLCRSNLSCIFVAFTGIQIPVKIGKIAGCYGHLNTMSLLKKVTGIQQIDGVLVNFQWRYQRGMINRVPESSANNAIL